MGRGTVGEVWDGSGDPRGDPGRVGGTSVRSGTGRGPTGRSWMGRGTLRGGPGRVGVPFLWSGETLG